MLLGSVFSSGVWIQIKIITEWNDFSRGRFTYLYKLSYMKPKICEIGPGPRSKHIAGPMIHAFVSLYFQQRDFRYLARRPWQETTVSNR